MSWLWGGSSTDTSEESRSSSSKSASGEPLPGEELSYTNVFIDDEGTRYSSSGSADPSTMGSAFFDQDTLPSENGQGMFYGGSGGLSPMNHEMSASSYAGRGQFPSHGGISPYDEESSTSPRVNFNAMGTINPGTVAPALGIYGRGLADPGGVEYVFSDDYKGMRKKSGAEQLTYLAGTAYLSGATVGGTLGLMEGLRSSVGKTTKLKLNAVLNSTAKRGALTANSLGILALLFSVGESAVYNYTCDDTAVNYAAAGAAAGALFKCTRGLKVAGLWSAAGAATALATVYASRRGVYGRRLQGIL